MSRQNKNTNFLLNNLFFISCRLWDNVEKRGKAGQATDDIITARTRFT